MATKKFLLQGFTANTHLNAVKRLFRLPDIERVILSVAFLNKAGVDLLSDELSGAGSKIEVFAGIRNGITSRQGLQTLMSHGAKVHYVDTGARHVIFHPKVYFALTKSKASVVLGSANLTLGGLNNNIEASVTIDLDIDNTDEHALADSIAAGFSNLTDEYPKHVVLLNDKDDLTRLQEEGRLVDEAFSSPPRTVKMSTSGKTDGLSRIKLKTSPIRGKVKRYALPSTKNIPKVADAHPTELPSAAVMSAELLLLWQSKPLVERDLSIPSGKNTHPTGSINLDKGLLDSEIDHRHYFRDEVFSSLSWTATNKETVDEAYARFSLIIKGIEHVEFTLRIAHTTSTTSKTYLQRNAMTRLSWGPMKEFVTREDLIGRTMSLYRHASDATRFVIEID